MSPKHRKDRDRHATESGRAGVAVLIGLAAAAGLVWWLAAPMQRDTEGATARLVEPDAQPVVLEPALPKVDPTLALPLDAVALPALAAQPADPIPPIDAEVPHYSRDDNPYRKFASPEYFEQKYADATTEELVIARETLGEEIPFLMNEVSTAWLDSGGGNREIVPRPSPTDELVKGPLHKSYGLVETSRTRDAGNGQMLKEWGDLPWEEHRSFYDKQDEKAWLIVEIRRRGGVSRGFSASGRGER